MKTIAISFLTAFALFTPVKAQAQFFQTYQDPLFEMGMAYNFLQQGINNANSNPMTSNAEYLSRINAQTYVAFAYEYYSSGYPGYALIYLEYALVGDPSGSTYGILNSDFIDFNAVVIAYQNGTGLGSNSGFSDPNLYDAFWLAYYAFIDINNGF